jgi:hypothetical protein
MDHGIKRSQLVHLVRKGLGFRDAGEISRNRGQRARDFGKRLVRPLLIATMQHYLLALLDQHLRFHETETVSRAGDEDFCHEVFPGDHYQCSSGDDLTIARRKWKVKEKRANSKSAPKKGKRHLVKLLHIL